MPYQSSLCTVVLVSIIATGTTATELTTYICNRPLKRLFLPTDYNVDIRKAVDPDRKILSFCPAMQLSCCSQRELEHIARSFRRASLEFNAHMDDVIQNLEIVDELFEAMQSGVLKTASDDDEGKNCGKMNNMAVEVLIQNLYRDKRKALKDLDTYSRMMIVYFSGFACIICDGIDITYITNTDTAYEINLSQSLCAKQLDLQAHLLRTAELIVKLSSLAQYLACKKGGVSQKEEWDSDLNSLKSRLEKTEKCLALMLREQEDTTTGACNYICRSILYVHYWEDEYMLRRNSRISKDIIRRYIESTRKQQFFDDVAKQVSRQFDEKSEIEKVYMYSVRVSSDHVQNFLVNVVKEDGIDFYMNSLEFRDSIESLAVAATSVLIILGLRDLH